MLGASQVLVMFCFLDSDTSCTDVFNLWKFIELHNYIIYTFPCVYFNIKLRKKNPKHRTTDLPSAFSILLNVSFILSCLAPRSPWYHWAQSRAVCNLCNCIWWPCLHLLMQYNLIYLLYRLYPYLPSPLPNR